MSASEAGEEVSPGYQLRAASSNLHFPIHRSPTCSPTSTALRAGGRLRGNDFMSADPPPPT